MAETNASRERFEKWANSLDVAEPDETKRDDIGHYKYSDVAYGWIAWQQAERDTRERCAQERKELLKNLASAMRKVLPSELLQEVIDRCDPLSAFLREIGEKSLTEHILGKE